MGYQFTDLIDIVRLQELMTRLYAAAGIPVGIIGTDGTIYVATGWQDICTRFHRQHPITSERCRESDEYISAHLDEAPYVQYRCKNGLWDIAVPIRLHGRHLATLFVGQFHFDDDPPDRDFFMHQAEEYGFNKEEYLSALDRLPVFSREKIRAIVDYYLLFVDQLVDEGANRLEMRSAEEELRITTQRLLLATSSGHLGVWDWNVKDNIMVWDDRMFELYGVNQDAFPGCIEAWINGLHPDDKERAIAECQAALEGGKTFDTSFRVVHPDGTVKYLKADGTVISDSEGTAVRMIGINRDITEQKHIEQALEHRLVTLTSPLDSTTNIQFEDLFNLEEIQKIQDAFAALTGVASIITDVAGKPITRPSNFCHLCEQIIRKTEKGLANCYRSDSVLGGMNPDGPVMQPCLSGGLWDGAASILVGGHHVANWLIGQVLDESCDLDGMMAYAREIGADEDAYRQALGSVPRMSREQFAKVCRALFLIAGQLSRQALQNVQQAKYITDIRQSQEALRRSEERYRSIIELAADSIMLSDCVGGIIGANESAVLLTGYTLKDLTGMTIARLFSEEELKRVPFRYDLLKEGKTVRSERFLFRRDGTTVPIEMNTKMMPDGTYQTFMRDMTQHRMMEAELIKSQKLESLGILAGGIAHDFNNILTGIMGNISFAKTMLDETQEAYSPLEKAEKASLRAADLARQLLVFAKGGQPVKKLVSLQRIVNEAVSFALSGTNVKCVIDTPHLLHIVEADEGQITQAFHNIIINAVHAMPEGGKLTVRGENVTVTDDNAGDLQTGEYVKLTFADEGCGISEADQKKIFDPYFTTKPGGTGLGLASTYSIIDHHGGHISVNSTVGVGTTFTICLPSTGKTDPDQGLGNAPVMVNHAGDSILVMDDEEMIRELASLTLGRAGYTVTTCVNGDDAISLYKSANEAGTPFSVVIMDLTIPGGLGGVEAARRLLAFDPAANLIVSSGYSDDPVMANYKEYGFCAAIEKPYRATDISMILAEVMKRAQ